jgi:hypothetical protein
MIKALTRSSMLSFAAIIALSALVGAPAQALERCARASQCHGALPQICMRCSGGQFSCAHWACVRHTCEVQICNGHLTRY